MDAKNSPASEEAIKSKKDPCFKHKNGSLFPKKRRLVKTMIFYSIASANSDNLIVDRLLLCLLICDDCPFSWFMTLLWLPGAGGSSPVTDFSSP
ncbi:hypothetical protein SADUNF_Sadunf05G0133300 [Salix dunnii]|uniref:Uncharacterized protein n=1 Tax=Salix dunnii TaxID=1413687 RepID=A0A835K524_9ROSI|nr:hypothetical protein SADUNF_Sadunf05G0133300 [Salix dunnii]